MLALSEAKRGETYTIKWMFGIPEVLGIMREYHIGEGTEIQVKNRYGGGVIISAKEKRLAIEKEIADRIKV